MKFETSTTIPPEKIKDIEAKLRKAAVDSKNEKFFGPDEKIEVINDASYPSTEELSKQADGVKPQGDPTLCAIAYEIAKRACSGDPICEIIAAKAYDLCVHS